MDPLSITASIAALLKLSTEILKYLNDVKDASKDSTHCVMEVTNLYSILFQLKSRLGERGQNQQWYTAVRALTVVNGPLDQFKEALEMLQRKLTKGGRLKQAGEALVWSFKKEEVASILGRMERLKTLIGFALQLDHE